MTFRANHDGVVFEKDLGPHTTELARKMKRFDPVSAAEAAPAGEESQLEGPLAVPPLLGATPRLPLTTSACLGRTQAKK